MLLGGYLLIVAAKGNGDALVATLKEESGFLKWLVAIFLFQTITGYLPGEIASILVVIIVAGGLLQASRTGALETAANTINGYLTK